MKAIFRLRHSIQNIRRIRQWALRSCGGSPPPWKIIFQINSKLAYSVDFECVPSKTTMVLVSWYQSKCTNQTRHASATEALVRRRKNTSGEQYGLAHVTKTSTLFDGQDIWFRPNSEMLLLLRRNRLTQKQTSSVRKRYENVCTASQILLTCYKCHVNVQYLPLATAYGCAKLEVKKEHLRCFE